MSLDGAALEPQDDDEHDQDEDDVGLDLLARARLLCQAANEIALPMLRTVQQLKTKPSPPKEKRKGKPSRPSTREEEYRSIQQRVSKIDKLKPVSRVKSRENSSKTSKPPQPPALPPIAAASLPEIKKQRPIGKPATRNKKKEVEEEESAMPLPQIHATDEWRKQRETEKIRQAQERAKARVLRKTTPVEPLPSKSNQQGDEDRERPESDVVEKMEASRRRALERVKLRKLELADEQTRAAAAKQDAINQHPHSEEAAKKTELFRFRTLQRLQAAKREAQAQESRDPADEDKAKPVDQPEDSDEKEKQRKRMEKQRRRETADRMKKQQQIAEDQQRKEQELFEKGLGDFKTKKKEQDRVAKGLPPTRPSADPVVVFESVTVDTCCAELTTDVQSSPRSIVGAHLPLESNAATDTKGNDTEEQGPAEGLTLVVAADSGLEEPLKSPSSEVATTTRPRPKKVPSWKQPPVPILPAEQYTHKAIVSPSDSYAERFQHRTGRPSPTPIPDVTFSPLHISRQRQRHTEPKHTLAPLDPASP